MQQQACSTDGPAPEPQIETASYIGKMAPPLTHEWVDAGLHETCKVVPTEVAEAITDNKHAVRASILAQHDADVVDQQHWFKEIDAAFTPVEDDVLSRWAPNACEMASGWALLNVVLFALGLAGLHVSANAKMARRLLEEMGQETVHGLQAGLHDMWVAYQARNAKGAAKELFGVLSGIYNAGGFGAVMKSVMAEMAWWDWLKTGAVALAQVVAWVATDGVAFIAECALTIFFAYDLWKSIESCVKECHLI